MVMRLMGGGDREEEARFKVEGGESFEEEIEGIKGKFLRKLRG